MLHEPVRVPPFAACVECVWCWHMVVAPEVCSVSELWLKVNQGSSIYVRFSIFSAVCSHVKLHLTFHPPPYLGGQKLCSLVGAGHSKSLKLGVLICSFVRPAPRYICKLCNVRRSREVAGYAPLGGCLLVL